MPKTGKERKARRRARQAEEAARASQQAPGGASTVGSVKASPLLSDASGEPLSDQQQAEAELVAAAGDHWDTAGRREMVMRDQRLVNRSLRWRTDATDRTFEGKNPRDLTAREIGILKTRVTLLDPDPKIALGLGLRYLIQLEAQNQRDELAYDPFKAPTAPGTADPAAPPPVQVVFNLPPNGRGPR